ncbi:hypothetical protein, partial [Porphyromonas sp.]|uniref:hypothetical protein n=1 Tax=Porphyromonas sp. TaxID=1924944 RepID=UPI003A910821
LGERPAARGGSPHPDERFTEEKSTELAKREKKLCVLLACELKKQRVTRIIVIRLALMPT